MFGFVVLMIQRRHVRFLKVLYVLLNVVQGNLNVIEVELATSKSHRKHYRDKKKELVEKISKMEKELEKMKGEAEVIKKTTCCAMISTNEIFFLFLIYCLIYVLGPVVQTTISFNLGSVGNTTLVHIVRNLFILLFLGGEQTGFRVLRTCANQTYCEKSGK